jgi:serine/threonine-protein kinase
MRGGLIVAIVVSVVTGRAQGQTGDASAAADQLFEQGRALAQQNRWPDACAKFEDSLRYEPALGTQLNLANCYKHIGKLASAWRLFGEAIEQATAAGDVERRDFARTQADALMPRLPKLTISVPQKPPAGLVVARDGAQVDAGALGVALCVDPGIHTITASAPGFEAFTQTVTLVEGKAETLAIPALVAVLARATVPAQAQDDGHVTTSQPEIVISSTRKYVAVAVGAMGMASIGVGIWFGAKASSSYDDAKALCGSNLACSTENYARGQQLIRDTRSEATISTVMAAAGVAAVVTGIVVFLTGRRPRERATAQLVPMIHVRDSGLAVAGRF